MNSFKMLTDYPDGIMKSVAVIGYDGNKYVRVDNESIEIKRGYVYRSNLRRPVQHKTLCRWFGLEV